MNRFVTLLSIVVLWNTPAYASKCSMHLTFENNHSTRIKVERLSEHRRFEQFSNITIPAGERGKIKRRHKLSGLGALNKGLNMSNGEKRIYLSVQYKIWEPQNNRWVSASAGWFTRTCRDKKNMFFKLPLS